MPRPGPVERIRARLAERAGLEAARRLPRRYQRLGRVVLVRWPEELRPEFAWLAEALALELHAETVARWTGAVDGPRRLPRLERLRGSSTETEVREDGVAFRLDAARVLYSRGNRTERARMARYGSPGERVADLFAGIGYFALPIARHGRPGEVVAVEENPDSYGYLEENVRRNRLGDLVRPLLGDNRTVGLPSARFDRVLLGYLPDATPWLGRALGLLQRTGGTVHLHRAVGSREPAGRTLREASEEVERLGGSVRAASVRTVKAYGPGREHRVLDLRVRPGPGGAGPPA